MIAWRWLMVGMVMALIPIAADAQPRDVYSLYSHSLPPGEITARQKWSRPGMATHVQPIRIRVPQGSLVAAATQGGFTSPTAEQLTIGIMVGYPYRVHVRWITPAGSFDVYPTIELIDRLYPPNQQMLVNFPILIELTADDLQLAVAGHMVSKVVYVEDADLPSLGSPDTVQPWFDVQSDEDPMEVADHMGRPVALVRLGSRTPTAEGVDDAFLFGSPPVTLYGDSGAVGSPATELLGRSAPPARPPGPNLRPGRNVARPVAGSATSLEAASVTNSSHAPTIWLSAGPMPDAPATAPQPGVFLQIRDEAPSP